MSQLREFLGQGLSGQELSLATLRPCTFVIDGVTVTLAGGGEFRDVPVMAEDGGGFVEKRRSSVRVLKSVLDAQNVTPRAGASDCTVNGVLCKVIEVRGGTIVDPGWTLTVEGIAVGVSPWTVEEEASGASLQSEDGSALLSEDGTELQAENAS